MLSTHDRDRYYNAAAIGLRALEAREARARRFGADADATWAAFAGSLHTSTDRLELLLRDASVAWGLAFDARGIFDLPAVATDDPYGTAWRHKSNRDLLDPGGPATLDAAAKALGVSVARAELPALSATSRLLVAGPSAIVSLANAFRTDPALSWDRQVTVVADAPAHRQLAGLCALFAAADAPTRVLRSTDPLPSGTIVLSSDAEATVQRAMGAR